MSKGHVNYFFEWFWGRILSDLTLGRLDKKFNKFFLNMYNVLNSLSNLELFALSLLAYLISPYVDISFILLHTFVYISLLCIHDTLYNNKWLKENYPLTHKLILTIITLALLYHSIAISNYLVHLLINSFDKIIRWIDGWGTGSSSAPYYGGPYNKPFSPGGGGGGGPEGPGGWTAAADDGSKKKADEKSERSKQKRAYQQSERAKQKRAYQQSEHAKAVSKAYVQSENAKAIRNAYARNRRWQKNFLDKKKNRKAYRKEQQKLVTKLPWKVTLICN